MSPAPSVWRLSPAIGMTSRTAGPVTSTATIWLASTGDQRTHPSPLLPVTPPAPTLRAPPWRTCPHSAPDVALERVVLLHDNSAIVTSDRIRCSSTRSRTAHASPRPHRIAGRTRHMRSIHACRPRHRPTLIHARLELTEPSALIVDTHHVYARSAIRQLAIRSPLLIAAVRQGRNQSARP